VTTPHARHLAEMRATLPRQPVDDIPAGSDERCARCGTKAPAFWCCTASDDGGPPWITLQFYDHPLTAYRMRDGFAELRESDGAGAHVTVTIGRSDVEALAAAFAKVTP